MATEDVILNYRGDASSLVRASSEASESLTELADKAKKKAKEAADAATEAVKRAQRAAERAAQEGSQAAQEAARDAARAAERAIDEARRAAQEASAATRESVDGIKDSFGGAGDAASKLGGVLESMGIEGAGAVGDLADAGEVLSGSLGAIGLSAAAAGVVLGVLVAAVAAGALAWKAYTEESDRAARIAEAQNEIMSAQSGLLEDTRDTLIAIKVENEELTEQEAELMAVRQAAFDSYIQSTETTRQKISELRKEQNSWLSQYAEAFANMPGAKYNPLAIAVDAVTTSVSEAQVEIDGLSVGLKKATDNVRANVQAHENLQDAQDKNKKATEGHTAAIKRESAELAAQKKAWAEVKAAMDELWTTHQKMQAGIEALQEAAAEASEVEREGSQAVRAERDKELAQLLELYQQTIQLGGEDADRAAATVAYTEAAIAIREKYHRLEREAILEQTALEAEAQAERDEQAEEAELAQAEQLAAQKDLAIQNAMDTASALASIAMTEFDRRVDLYHDAQEAFQKSKEGMTEAERKAAKEQLKEQRKAAKAAFRINQGIQIAQAVAGAALAILNAFATVPYPGSIIAAAAAATTGAATIATVAAQKPQFHQGGIVQANLLPGEGVANRDLVRAVGESNFEAMNRNPAAAGAALSGGGTTLIIGRREVGEIGRSLMVGRTPVSAAITSRPKAGQLATGTTTLPVLA